MSYLPLDLTGIVFAVALFIALLLYLHEYNLRKKMESEADEFLQDLKEKGWENLHESIKKSDELVEEAELEGIKIVAQKKLDSAKQEKEYAQDLKESLSASKETLIKAQDELLNFMKDLQQRSHEFEEASKNAAQERINQLFDRVENRLADFLIKTEQQTTTAIELELKGTRQFIDTYKNQQLKLIDENIIAMMEQTLNIVLAKKLSLKDQLELIYEALERAKTEKFMV